ncbi:MAG: antirestriction protein ArdA [Candidatus Nanoarchaeia archaeon]|nr:antirestriction protein ArdA [Candidatus Nanoarchaeia archaeon]
MNNRIALTNMYKRTEDNIIWLDLPFLDSELEEALETLGCEDVTTAVIVDSEIELDDYEITEDTDLEKLNNFFESVANIDDNDEIDRLEAIYEVEKDWNTALAIYDDGDYEFYANSDLEEVAEELVDEGLFGEVSDNLKCYIDYEAIGKDLGHDGYIETENGHVIRIF